MMFKPGDVIGFYKGDLGKEKYHLCISLCGFYVYVSTQRNHTYASDLVVDCSEFPFLKPTDSGKSRISFSRILEISDHELKRKKSLKKLGAVSSELLHRILAFIEGNPVIPPEIQDAVLDGITDWA